AQGARDEIIQSVDETLGTDASKQECSALAAKLLVEKFPLIFSGYNKQDAINAATWLINNTNESFEICLFRTIQFFGLQESVYYYGKTGQNFDPNGTVGTNDSSPREARAIYAAHQLMFQINQTPGYRPASALEAAQLFVKIQGLASDKKFEQKL